MIDIWSGTEVEEPKKSESYHAKLMKVVNNNTEYLKLVSYGDGSPFDLDDPRVFRQKKVKEKVIQLYKMLFTSYANECKVIRLCLRELFAKKLVNSVNFKDALMKNGYSEKTALAQSSQMIVLLHSLEVTCPAGRGLYHINNHSLLAPRLVELVNKGD